MVALDPKKEMEDVYRCISMLRTYEKRQVTFPSLSKLSYIQYNTGTQSPDVYGAHICLFKILLFFSTLPCSNLFYAFYTHSDILDSVITLGQPPPMPRSLALAHWAAKPPDSLTISSDDSPPTMRSTSASATNSAKPTHNSQVVSSDDSRLHNGINIGLSSRAQAPASSSTFILPYYSHELGTLPLHGSGDLGTSVNEGSPSDLYSSAFSANLLGPGLFDETLLLNASGVPGPGPGYSEPLQYVPLSYFYYCFE